MTRNTVLRRIRDAFDLTEADLVAVFAQAEYPVTEEDIVDWLRREEDPAYIPLYDDELAVFLNGLIIEMRGRKDGPLPEPEETLTNNIILRKLQIAFNFKAEDILEILGLVDIHLEKYELSAFFRKPEHKNYRPVRDKLLNGFLKGLKLKTDKTADEASPDDPSADGE